MVKGLFVLVLLIFPALAMKAQSSQTVTVDNMNYELTENYAICTGYAVVPTKLETIKIPDEISVDGKRYKVEELGQEAFTSEKIGKSVKQVIFPSGLKRIDGWCFFNGFTEDKSNDFLTSDRLVLPESLESVGYAAFANTNIKAVYIPASVTQIGEQAFNGCEQLTTFEVASKNEVYASYSQNGFVVLYNVPEDFIVQVCGTGQGEGNFTTAHALGRAAFNGCKNLKHFSVAVPTSANYIVGQDAFYNCKSLETIDFSQRGTSMLMLDGVPSTQLYNEQTKKNMLRRMFGDLPALKSLTFREDDLSDNVVKGNDGIYYVLEKSSSAAKNYDCAGVLFVTPYYETNAMKFSTLSLDAEAYPIMSVKNGAFSEKVSDVYFKLSQEQAALVGQAYKVDETQSSKTPVYHVSYPCTVDGASHWMSYYDDDFTTKYKTIYFDRPFVMPEGLRGAVIAGAEGRALQVSYQYEGGDVVPAGTGLLLKKDDEIQEETKIRYHVYPQNADVTPKAVSGENHLLGWASNQLGGGSTMIPSRENTWFYMLSRDKKHEKIGFYWAAENGASFETKSNRAYLALPANMPSPVSAFTLDEQDVTGIDAVENEGNAEKTVYTIDGRKVEGSLLSKGIYVVNGQKIIVK
mgnify:FL=1